MVTLDHCANISRIHPQKEFVSTQRKEQMLGGFDAGNALLAAVVRTVKCGPRGSERGGLSECVDMRGLGHLLNRNCAVTLKHC